MYVGIEGTGIQQVPASHKDNSTQDTMAYKTRALGCLAASELHQVFHTRLRNAKETRNNTSVRHTHTHRINRM